MKIKNHALAVAIWSDNYLKLAKWYIDILGLKVKQQASLPNDSFVAFDFGENWFWIGQHDKVKGKNKDPYRIMIEFYVESVSQTYKHLKEKKIKIIAKPFQDPTDQNGWCMTAADPEENIIQFYGKK